MNKMIATIISLLITVSPSFSQDILIKSTELNTDIMHQNIEINLNDQNEGTIQKEVFLKTEDGIDIAINHFDSGKKDSVLIICPGWHMTKDSFVFTGMSKEFFKNTDVIAMDFRGHGHSSGFFTFSAKEYLDLKAVVDYAKIRYSKISLMGFSLGAATSIIYASIYKDVDKVIAVSPPTEFGKIENSFYKKEAFMPTLKKFEPWRMISVRPGSPFEKKIKPIDVIQSVSPIPILILAGGKDPTIYPWHAEELFEKAGYPKRLKIYQNDSHAEDIYMQSHDSFLSVCNNWLK